MAMSPWRQPGSAMRRRTRALGHRSALRSLFLAGVLLPSMPALACSPAAFPQHALRDGGVGMRMVVVGEVISIRASGRLDALRQHRAAMQRYAIEAQAPPDKAPSASGAPPPPPIETVMAPALAATPDPQVQVELFVYESLKGAAPETLMVPAGGQCGHVPRVGQHVLAMVSQPGPTHLMFGPGLAPFAPAWLEEVRTCMRGGCAP